MESKYNRVGLCGASGTGKTTLAKHISEVFQLPYINTSSSSLWHEYGYENHEDVHRDALNFYDPRKPLALQEEIFKLRDSLFHRNYFVTDRTPIDQAAYFLYYFPLLNPLTKTAFISKLSKQIKKFDALIFVEYCNTEIENNGKRITDPLYQTTIDIIMEGIMKKNVLGIDIPILVVNEWDWKVRTNSVEKFLSK